jgi:hypothetical protein
VFTARYTVSPYIKQIRFVFKGLICMCGVMLNITAADQSAGISSASRVTDLSWSLVKIQNMHFITINIVDWIQVELCWLGNHQSTWHDIAEDWNLRITAVRNLQFHKVDLFESVIRV